MASDCDFIINMIWYLKYFKNIQTRGTVIGDWSFMFFTVIHVKSEYHKEIIVIYNIVWCILDNQRVITLERFGGLIAYLTSRRHYVHKYHHRVWRRFEECQHWPCFVRLKGHNSTGPWGVGQIIKPGTDITQTKVINKTDKLTNIRWKLPNLENR